MSQKMDFKSWLEKKQYWEQYLWKLHIENGAVSESDISKCYQYLLEDSKVIAEASGRVEIVFSPLDFNAKILKQKITLDKIENLKDVNAIDDGCVVEFGKNMTIIYGDNGTGKSGIGRLFSNACFSREPRQLLPNARTATDLTQRASADFHLSDITGPKPIIKYTIGGQIHEALKSFSVFDHECAICHLDNENKVEFIPSKIKIFDEVFKSITAIEEKLKKEVTIKKQDDPKEALFADTSAITVFLDALSHKTTGKEIDNALTFTLADNVLLDKKKKELEKKLKQDVSKQKKELQDECDDLNTFKSTLTTKGTVLSKTKEIEINKLIKEIKEKKDIADKLSAKNFDFSAFKNVGSYEWKSLIMAAQKLYEKETASNSGIEPAHCVLCRQTLTSKEKTLFGEYWKFLKSTAETELATARQSLATALENIGNEISNYPTFSDTEVAVKILKKTIPNDFKKIKNSFAVLKTQISEWDECMKKEANVTFTKQKIDLNPIATLIADKKKAEVALVDPNLEIKTLKEEILSLEQKQRAYQIITKIKNYVDWLRWENAVKVIKLQETRRSITCKKTEIMEALVISQYINIFNEETKKLDCNFGLKVEARGKDANTIKRLRLEFAPRCSPSDILSEGEQTVSALVSFLTEARLENNSGIIFDDPVTSLDHEWKTTIAKRLVEEAKKRQVVVLTHDIIFLLDLQSYAEREKVEHRFRSMRKNCNKIGIIKPDLPWIALDVKKKAGYLRNELPVLKKAEASDPEEYRNKVKLWYLFLREAWERAVEERLFKGVVQRFNKSVQTQKLEKVDINPTLIKEVTDGMTESSSWLHDMAAGMNPAVPKNAKLETEVKKLKDFITKCKAP